MADAMSLLLILNAVAFPAVARLPRSYGVGETLGVAGGAVEAVLAREQPPYCSVILLTDGTTSATTVFTELGGQEASGGMTMFEAATLTRDHNLTQAQLPLVFSQVRRLRQVSGCVTLVVVSDDPAFLTASAEWSLKGRLLTWSNKLLAVTRRPLQDLPHLYTSFSMMNSMLIIVNASVAFPRCVMYVHLPYSPSGEVEVVRVGTWSSKHGLRIASRLPLFPDKFSKFLERPRLVVAAEEFQPHVSIKTTVERPGQTLSFAGPMERLLDLLAHSLNFTYSFRRPPDGSWGTKLQNGSWTGMVGMVGRQEADLGLGPFGISATRAEMVDFTEPILIDYARIMAGRGRPEVDPWGFLLPLGPLVWTAILAALLVVLVAVFLLSFFVCLKGPQRESWPTESFFSYIRVLLQQDVPVVKHRWWERLVLGSWMVMTLVLTKSYAGNLMSMLAVRYIPQPYQSLRDVLDDPSATMIWEANTAYVQFLRSAESGIFREIIDSEASGRLMYVKSTQYARMRDKLVRAGKHVFMGEDLSSRVLMAQDFSNTGRCEFYASKEVFLPFMFSMIGQKNSPLLPVINERINAVTEAGLYGFWMDTTIPNSTSCTHASSKITVNSSLSVTNLWGMFVVLAGGHTVALLLLCFELLAAARHTQT
ncbi:probable glutamate receptor isoform X2 [Panulirus ornatus]|uniref:probable glutamate receptor isoform X2 n=1 Tax=Panulirus ornatus TaxID=150431 RepID=UPI003A866AE1